MAIPFEGGTVSVRDVLSDLGFEEDWSAEYTDELPGYTFDFGNLMLTAVQVTNEYLQPQFQFGGVTRDARSLARIDFQIPLMVESLEQGAAWIADALDRQHFTPRRAPSWMESGREWQGHLPWVRQRKAYESRPKCRVDRDWLRVAARRLRDIAKDRNVDSLAIFSFDGSVLKIGVDGNELLMAATGTAWPVNYATGLADLLVSVKRLMSPEITVAIWDKKLHIGRHCLPLVAAFGDLGPDAE